MSGLGARLRNFFTRLKKPEPEPAPKPQPEPQPKPGLIPAKINQRISRVAESILGNEQLTSDLDDSAAKELLDWGLNVARQIVQGTAGEDNDEAAEQAIYPRLRATRSMMRAVNRWIANQQKGDAEGRDKAFNNILEQASVIYGRPFAAMDNEQRAAVSRVQTEYASDPPQMIAHLRELFERPDDIPDSK